MDSQASLLRQLSNTNLSRDQRAELRCQLAREYEDTGDYEAARQAMGELWQRIGEHPRTEGLELSIAAEVLLRVGVLTGWIGNKNQIAGTQETAKNLLTESLTIFQSLNYGKKIAEAQTELALCYWRAGEHYEARDYLKEALSRLTTDSELKAKAILRRAIVERSTAQLEHALRILTDNAALFEKIRNHTLIGGFHNALAGVLEDLGTPEHIDRAFVEYAAAGYHFEQACHKYYRAHVENNLGFLYFKVGRYAEAHEHLNYARRLLMYLKDSCGAAQANETRARVFIAEGNYTEAERIARAAVSILEKSGQQALLIEALTTHGTALARLGFNEQARSTLQCAIALAQQVNVPSSIAEAKLAGLDKQATKHQLSSLGEEIRQREHDLIEQALIKTKGRLTQAARLLGTSHQQLAFLLESRHKDLLALRTPIKPRRKRKP
jgi:tetratricopeptide (TPR) repeat protein